MNLPWACHHCGREHWIDLDKLERRPVNKVFAAEGFACKVCSAWTNVFYTSRTMEDAMNAVRNCPSSHLKYRFLVARCLRKAISTRAHAEGFQQ